MNFKRELFTWLGLALGGLALLSGILLWQSKHVVAYGAIYLSTDAAAGADVFREKGCDHCHGSGAGVHFDGREGGGNATASLPRLVTSMWNHAPRMWERMEAEKLVYPEFTYKEMGQLTAYLYLSQMLDAPGDADHGRELFTRKGCARCHSEADGARGPSLQRSVTAADPMNWTQVMWNHAAGMQEPMRLLGVAWPRFERDELRDLLAYVGQLNRERSAAPRETAPGDPENGWRVFQAKGCIACHSVNSAGSGHAGPDLGPESPVPPTFFRFAGSILNHFPDMRRAATARNVPTPMFQGREMADLIAFIYSLRYREPGGSPHVGESVFSWRGCDRCHGAAGEGGRGGPALRGRGQSYTAIRLASILWDHGARMYQQSRKMGQDWPQLASSDVGDILAFLNEPTN